LSFAALKVVGGPNIFAACRSSPSFLYYYISTHFTNSIQSD
jgi:hypothetical protein